VASAVADRTVDKVAQRRSELAAAALKTLAEQGYARTGLRDIAANSEFSHGVLHYYFRDKVDLITHCVREYKAQCVTRYDEVVATASSASELAAGFLDKLSETLVEEAALHRLWYDLRGQSMFEESFRADVAEIDLSLERMIWRVLSRYAELAGVPLDLTPPTAYAVFDGLFLQALLRQLAGDADAARDLRAAVAAVIGRLVPTA
jgi:AcrR family transcriptional regulator